MSFFWEGGVNKVKKVLEISWMIVLTFVSNDVA